MVTVGTLPYTVTVEPVITDVWAVDDAFPAGSEGVIVNETLPLVSPDSIVVDACQKRAGVVVPTTVAACPAMVTDGVARVSFAKKESCTTSPIFASVLVLLLDEAVMLRRLGAVWSKTTC